MFSSCPWYLLCLVPMFDITITFEGFCICKGVCCLVCWNMCVWLHMDTHNSIHVLPHSPSSCILMWKWTLSHLPYAYGINTYIHVCVDASILLLQSTCSLCVGPIATSSNSPYPCMEMKVYCHLYLYVYIDFAVLISLGHLEMIF